MFLKQQIIMISEDHVTHAAAHHRNTFEHGYFKRHNSLLYSSRDFLQLTKPRAHSRYIHV